MLLPSRSTLFPYTTLFRSSPACEECKNLLIAAADRDQEPPPVRQLFRQGCRYGRRPSRDENGVVRRVVAPAERPDRKSTRLNSSHSQISYAVFCLKKKKRQ